jgi:hypothetical protein
MTFLRIQGFLLAAALQSAAQGPTQAPTGPNAGSPKWNVSIPVEPEEGVPVTASEPPLVSGSIVSSHTYRRTVTETPPIPGLPPITGTADTTIEVIEPSSLPEAPAPLMHSEPGVVRKIAPGTSLVSVSATVHDHRHTFLRIHLSSNPGDQVSAWSNLDFNLFRGWSNYQVDLGNGSTRDYYLLMGIGDVLTEMQQRLATLSGAPYVAPEIPVLPDVAARGPAFHVVSGVVDSPAMEVMEQIHDLFRKEGARMTAAHLARQQAEADRRAQLLANPPKPADVTIRYWKGTTQETEVTE